MVKIGGYTNFEIGERRLNVALVHRIVEDKQARGAVNGDAEVAAQMDRLSRIAALEHAAGEPWSEIRAA